MYAKITRWFAGDHEIIQVTASMDKNCLGNSGLCEYVYTGIYSESSVEEMLNSIKTKELYIDSETLERFAYGFYQKFSHILKVNQI